MPFDGTEYKTEVQLTLEAARALVAERWCKKALRKQWKHGAAYCVIGAIRMAIYGADTYSAKSPLEDRVQEAIRWAIQFPPYVQPEITAWNDAKDRKKEEVLAMFDRAIAGSGV